MEKFRAGRLTVRYTGIPVLEGKVVPSSDMMAHMKHYIFPSYEDEFSEPERNETLMFLFDRAFSHAGHYEKCLVDLVLQYVGEEEEEEEEEDTDNE
jgi:hypothetical protein